MRLVVLVVALTLAAPVRGEEAAPGGEPVFDAPVAAPTVYGPLLWRRQDIAVHGYWYTDAQVKVVSGRIDYLEQRAAKECVDAQIETQKGSWPLWTGVVLGLLAGAGGAYAAMRVRH